VPLLGAACLAGNNRFVPHNIPLRVQETPAAVKAENANDKFFIRADSEAGRRWRPCCCPVQLLPGGYGFLTRLWPRISYL